MKCLLDAARRFTINRFGRQSPLATIGKIVATDTDSGDFEVTEYLLTAAENLLGRPGGAEV